MFHWAGIGYFTPLTGSVGQKTGDHVPFAGTGCNDHSVFSDCVSNCHDLGLVPTLSA